MASSRELPERSSCRGDVANGYGLSGLRYPGSGSTSKATWPTDADLARLESERLHRFPQVVSADAAIASHQLGWRMAVLPFRSTGAPIGHGLALGMAEEISAALSRFRLPRLVASATFWGGTEPVDDAMGRCRTYALDYIIDGTIDVEGDDIRVHVTLLDVVLAFEVIWSGRFDGHMGDLFSLQSRIASETVAQIDPELFQRGSAFDPPCRTEIAAAHHSVLTAIQGIFRLDRSVFLRARDLLTRAIELDPGYAAAYTWLAYWCLIAVGQGWADRPQQVTTLAGEAAKRAVRLDPLDARALSIAGHVEAYLLGNVGSATAMHARALELNPNLPVVWTLSGLCKIYTGHHTMAIRHASMSKSLSPRDPHIFLAEHTLMSAYLFNRQLEEADLLSDVVLGRNGDHVSALNIRLAILGHLGRAEEAGHCLSVLQAIEPDVSVAAIVSRAPLVPADRAFYADGLVRAGVPA